ncbi:hypothetical protein GOP47_0001134 [Adiantum capillus-veneris]|uniref:Peptidase A1 domain-containing protein n=1 Tax=Adiantum capillus-veneris TaxID=13818 RepID=A0A9D4VF88_ADICA|nr:hypothetical protein GOP47_0001134 [Adiantum capillus-veneris]
MATSIQLAACDQPLLLLLLLFTSFSLSCFSHQQYDQHLITSQWLHVAPLEEQFTAATPAYAASTELNVHIPKWSSSREDENGAATLALKVIHRDSPYSPLATLLQSTPQQLLIQRLNRDASRVEALSLKAKLSSLAPNHGDLNDKVSYTKGTLPQSGFSSPLSSGFKQGSGEYFIRLGVGTPPKDSYMVIDTGSDVMWIQCAPCLDCYEQTDPLFNPAASSSYRKLSCKSPVCAMLELHGCGGAGSNHCLYQVAYGDGSFTAGEFSAEALHFGGGMTARVAMGCGHDNEGLFTGAAGLFGLGGGALSFPSQMGRRYSKVFSYCLMDRDREGYSTLEFGGRGEVPRGTMYTPLIRNANLETFYYVSMSGISVGGQLLTIPTRAFLMDESGGGGVIVDSGTSVTRLVEVAYGPLRSAFKAAARGLPFAGGFSLFDTCYDMSGRASVKLPTLSLHFEGGAELALPASNYFIPVDSKGTYCLAFASTPGELSIIGNIQQQGFRVIFDSASSRLGFVPNQC